MRQQVGLNDHDAIHVCNKGMNNMSGLWSSFTCKGWSFTVRRHGWNYSSCCESVNTYKGNDDVHI